MRLSRPLVLVAALAAPALAQEEPKKPDAPVAPDAPKADAKKERKVDPAAMKALERHSSLVWSPANSGVKSLIGKGDAGDEGGKIELNPKWSQEKGFDLDVVLPAEVKAQIPDGAEEQVVAQARQQMGMLGVNSVFETPGRNWSHFDVSAKAEGEDLVVELKPFDDEADAAARTYVFGKDGLLKKSSMSPKVDPNNPQSAMLEGMTFDAEWKFEKKGERNALVGRTFSIMGQEISTLFAYYDVAGGVLLPKTASVSTPQGDQTIEFHDFVVDGKPVESTKAAAAQTPAKPAEPAKPADGPTAAPPAEPVK